ncbi:MAG: type II toxin-antitoxin system RelE/ParE family toxin [Nitrospinae bacterium]|nr:type II toxin-antitoxin system RelE/ParE family toxin [Nitrospinota bacterium]
MSEPAQNDLTAIYTHIAQESPDSAERFVADLIRQMYKLAELEITGAPRDWIRPGLRAFPYRQRCIYFRDYEDRIVIVRVLHGRQDIEPQEF